MDFIIDLPKAKGKEVIVFAVDRLTKYAHFVGLSHPSSVITVGQAFLDNIYRLHGLPHSIVSDRDPVFISTFGDTFLIPRSEPEVILRKLTVKRRSSTIASKLISDAWLVKILAKWIDWLPLAKWWYNTTLLSTIKTTPFEAL